MTGILLLGFLIGMAHALEADHLAAVGAMATDGKSSKKGLALRGAVWGLGHTLTLFAICALVLIFGFVLTDKLAATLEFSVGIMLVLLGLDVVRRMYKKKVHFHVHDHGDGERHIHAHSHSHESGSHEASAHEHKHAKGFPTRALFVGLIHGAAGSAGLLALVIAATQEPWLALAYVALFGIGSILGMAALSFVVAWPLGAAEKHAKRAHNFISYGAAAVAIYVGVTVILETAPAAFAGML